MDLRRPALRWTCQELTEVATIAQLATPREGEVSIEPCRTSLRWTSQDLTKVATVAQSAAPREGEVSSGSPCHPLD